MIETNTYQRDDKLLNEKIEVEVKKYGVLKNAFSKIYDAEVSLREKRIQSFEAISKIEEKDNSYLQKIYTDFHKTMAELEGIRKKQIDKINEKILPATVYYPEKVREFKSNLGKISEFKKQKDKQQTEILRAKTKNDFEKVGKLSSDYKKNEDQERDEGAKLEKGLLDFEANRVTDNKFLLLHYIHAELAYHANCLEKLSDLYSQVNCHDPKELLPVFINKYQLSSVRDVNIEKDYNCKLGETNRKLERIERIRRGEMAGNTGGRSASVGNLANPQVSPSGGSRNLREKLDNEELFNEGGVSTNQPMMMSNAARSTPMVHGKTLVSSQIK